MKKIFFLLGLLCASENAQAESNEYTLANGVLDAAIVGSFPLAYAELPRDKFYHYVAGAATSVVANRVCDAWIFKNYPDKKWLSALCGVGSSMLVGGLKELYDSKHGGTVEFDDFLATSAGGAVVTLHFVF